MSSTFGESHDTAAEQDQEVHERMRATSRGSIPGPKYLENLSSEQGVANAVLNLSEATAATAHLGRFSQTWPWHFWLMNIGIIGKPSFVAHVL